MSIFCVFIIEPIKTRPVVGLYQLLFKILRDRNLTRPTIVLNFFILNPNYIRFGSNGIIAI